MAEPVYGTLPTIKRVDITAAGDVTFWFVGAACAQTSEDFPKDSPINVWLRELEAQLTRDLLILHHGYGCELDGTPMTGPCEDCKLAQEAF